MKEGGRITRIIEGEVSKQDIVLAEQSGDNVALSYKTVIDNMKIIGIEVIYVEGFHSKIDYDFTWVRLSEISEFDDVIMTWQAGRNSKSISQCGMTTGPVIDVETTWDELEGVYKKQRSIDDE